MIVFERINTSKLEKALSDSAPIERIQIKIAIGNDSGGLKNVTITDSTDLFEINRLLQHSSKPVDVEVKSHTGLADCHIYKSGKKFNFLAIKTVKYGWVFQMEGNKYKNDSLVHVMIEWHL